MRKLNRYNKVMAYFEIKISEQSIIALKFVTSFSNALSKQCSIHRISNSTHQLLIYADAVNILGGSTHTTKREKTNKNCNSC